MVWHLIHHKSENYYVLVQLCMDTLIGYSDSFIIISTYDIWGVYF